MWITLVTALVIPGPFLGIVLSEWFSRPGMIRNWLYDQTAVVPILALCCRVLPWQLLITWFGFLTIPAEQIESARLSGAGHWHTLWNVAIPQAGWCLFTSFVVAVVLAVGDLTMSILVMPPGISTLSIRVFGMLHAAVDDRAAALCLWIGISAAVGVAIAWLSLRQQWSSAMR
jgi:iron(III) transport system permease protein